MKKINILIILIMLSTSAISELIIDDIHVIYVPDYMEVNESNKIWAKSNDPEQTINMTATLLIEQEQIEFIKDYTLQEAHLYVTNEEEEDIPYTISVFESAHSQIINVGDDELNTYERIINNDIYGFEWEHLNVSHTQGTIESDLICPYIKLNKGIPTIRGIAYLYDSNGTLNYNYGDEITITNTNYENICLQTSILFTENVTSPFKKYFGFECTNCDIATTNIDLGIDDNGVINHTSFTQTTINDTRINETINFMFDALAVESAIVDVHTGTLKFRIPYYLNITLIDNYNTSFNPIFNYIYLQNSSSTTNYADIGTTLGNILSFGLLSNTNSLDQTLTFWSEMNENNKATIKLYEKGNYSINLLTLKTFQPNAWDDYEFIKPQYTDQDINTRLTSDLIITKETDSEVLIQASEYELNKAGLIINWVKIIIFLVIAIIGIIIAFYTPNPIVAISILITIILPTIAVLLNLK